MGFGGRAADTYLYISEMYLAIYTTFVPFHTHLFGVCPPGTHQARAFQGDVSGCQADFEVQSLGRKWL